MQHTQLVVKSYKQFQHHNAAIHRFIYIDIYYLLHIHGLNAVEGIKSREFLYYFNSAKTYIIWLKRQITVRTKTCF